MIEDYEERMLKRIDEVNKSQQRINEIQEKTFQIQMETHRIQRQTGIILWGSFIVWAILIIISFLTI